MGDGSDSEESDADKQLVANKRPKVVGDKSNGSTCETSADNESDSLLDEIAQSLTDTEKTAPKVSEKLAKIVNLRWLNKLDETNLKEKSDKYLRPINCDWLITPKGPPKVNPEIWGRLDRQTRGKDLRLSNLQTTLTKVGNYGGLLGPSKVPLFFYFDSYTIDSYKCRSTLITVDRHL